MDEAEIEWLMVPEAPEVETILAELVNRPAWHRQAACRGMGTESFFLERGRSTAAAAAVCAGCSVRQECLSAALADPATSGIWGGVSQRGRRVLRKAVA